MKHFVSYGILTPKKEGIFEKKGLKCGRVSIDFEKGYL